MEMGKLQDLSVHRTCPECGAEFMTKKGTDGHEIHALEQFSDHLTTHQSTSGQWAEAHHRIQEWNRRAKSAG
jgi:hypothetical protein